MTALLVLIASATTAWAWGPLNTPAETYGEALILDIRSPDDFERGHIPGAVNTPYGAYRGPGGNPGRVPDLADLQDTLRDAGARHERPVLVVHQGSSASDFGARDLSDMLGALERIGLAGGSPEAPDLADAALAEWRRVEPALRAERAARLAAAAPGKDNPAGAAPHGHAAAQGARS